MFSRAGARTGPRSRGGNDVLRGSEARLQSVGASRRRCVALRGDGVVRRREHEGRFLAGPKTVARHARRDDDTAKSRESFPLESQAEGPIREMTLSRIAGYFRLTARRRAFCLTCAVVQASRLRFDPPSQSVRRPLPAPRGDPSPSRREQRPASGQVRGGARIPMAQRLATDPRVSSGGSQPTATRSHPLPHRPHATHNQRVTRRGTPPRTPRPPQRPPTGNVEPT